MCNLDKSHKFCKSDNTKSTFTYLLHDILAGVLEQHRSEIRTDSKTGDIGPVGVVG